MSYKEKYKRALDRAREVHRNEPDKVSTMEFLFPELREDEAEKVRKALIQGEQKSVDETQADNEDSFVNTSQINSEANQDYSSKFKVGTTFTGLIPCWVCAPSTLQPAHKYNGKNVVVVHESNGGYRCICVDDVKPVTFHLPEGTAFVEGWRRKLSEWTEEDDKMVDNLSKFLTNDFGMFNKDTLKYKRWLCKLKSKRLC